MDARTTAALACAIAGICWVIGGLAILVARIRFGRDRRRALSQPVADLHLHGSVERPAHRPRASGIDRVYGLARRAGSDDSEARALLRQGLRSSEPEVRRASVTALGRLGRRYDWAIDGLIEALAERRDTPARVAAQLDRLAPRADRRLVPLLEHPNSVVRYYAARLLAREDEIGLRFVPDLTRDPSPHVRAAALEALQTIATGGALRSALQLLDDPHPLVRAHACRTASAISAVTAAPCVAPLLGDASWEVREAAREALVLAGSGVANVVLPLLEEEDSTLRSLAALVLQDIGFVNELLALGNDPGLLERIFAAGGRRIRALAADSARGLPPLDRARPMVSEAGR